MCVPPAILAAVTTFASTMMTNRQQNKTPQTVRNEIPQQKTVRQGSQGLDPDQLKKEDEDIKVVSTQKQRDDRNRARAGLKTLAARNAPPEIQLPSAPSQGITTT